MKYSIEDSTLERIANSIRAKKGTTDKIKAEDFANEIGDIPAPVPPNLQDKSIEITENGTTSVSADEGFDGLGILNVLTNVNTGGGELPASIKKIKAGTITIATLVDYYSYITINYNFGEIPDLFLFYIPTKQERKNTTVLIGMGKEINWYNDNTGLFSIYHKDSTTVFEGYASESRRYNVLTSSYARVSPVFSNLEIVPGTYRWLAIKFN